jgi:glycyl-tRNA synthetase beta chain
MAGELLLEIGTEEIPSDYLDKALEEMRRLAETYLESHRIKMKERFTACGTPRRLVLFSDGISEKQEDTEQEITGPPKRAAFDQEGKPTKAALGFAQKQGVSVDQLQILETPKGEYLYIKRKTPGRLTTEVLSEMLPKLIAEIPWPKSMRWGSGTFSFVRPIHWVVALFDGSVIPFELAGVKSGDTTRGHRFLSPRALKVKGVADYREKMKQCHVIIDQAERRMRIEQAALAAAHTLSGSPVTDPELLTTVTHMVEFPTTVSGSFDRAFLHIPDAVLITAMKKHQKYFALRDQAGRLMPNFVAVNNTLARDESVVRKGHERVLRARLSDASFFFREDRQRTLESRLEDLKGVIYQAQLGTSYAKVQRFTRLAEYLAQQLAPEKTNEVRLAARLCKCDLVTQMVTEFPTLQGVMGMEYARLDGHPEDVSLAIHEHYLPARAGDELPSSTIGAIVGMADRMDTIAGFFAVQMEPTGAADPFALRRHALAIIRIIEHVGRDISLKGLVSEALSLLGEEISFDRDLVIPKVMDFFRERYRQMMLRSEYAFDLVEAVISVDFDRINQLRFRMDQMALFMKESKEFEPLVLVFKRVSNILKSRDKAPGVDPALFKEPCEIHLWGAYQTLKDDVQRLMEEWKYTEVLDLMVRLIKPVNDLFEGVEILTKDNPQVRDNRIALLQTLSAFLGSIADFSKFSV